MIEYQDIISMKELGERIKDVRSYLLMTQQKVSSLTGLPISMLSKIENGKTVNSGSLIKLLCFYANYISLDYLFAKTFSIDAADSYSKSFSMNTVVKARINMITSEMNTSLEKTRRLMESKLKETSELL